MPTLQCDSPKYRARPFKTALLGLTLVCTAHITACQSVTEPTAKAVEPTASCQVEFIILGTGQDAGAPQIGYGADPAHKDASLRQTATSGALVDHRNADRFLFEATPDISEQLYMLDRLTPRATGAAQKSLGLSGLFITHAHIGHYAGLMYLGREAASTHKLPVFMMPRLKTYVETNGPWAQLVTLGNISPVALQDKTALKIGMDISVTPYRVPHRDEYSETVGFRIDTPQKSVFFLPDIDSWDEWATDFGVRVEDLILETDYAFLDATFYADTELDRDMSEIPHPRVSHSMDRFDRLPEPIRKRVHFIHYNHSNKIRFKDSPESQTVRRRGYNIARSGARYCLME